MDANLLGSTVISGAADSQIVVMPTTERYVDQLQTLEYIGYNLPVGSDEFVITAEMFRNHLRVFPEGQFMALDLTTDRVVGFTTSMRLSFDPARPILDSWHATTGYG